MNFNKALLDSKTPFKSLIIGHSEKVEKALSICYGLSFDSVSFTEPDELLTRLQADETDLLLLPVNADLTERLEFCDQIRMTPGLEDILLLVFSSETAPEMLIEASQRGIDDWIDDTQSIDQIAARIHLLIQRQHRHKSQAYQRIRENNQQQLYRDMVNNSPDGIFIVQNDTIKFVNPGLINISGFSHEELLNSSFQDYILPKDREVITQQYPKLLKNGLTLSNCRFRILTKDQQQRWIKLRKIQQISWNGNIALIGYLSDITRRIKRKEVEIQSEKMVTVSCLAASIAHEINNPLAAVIQSAQNIVRRLNPSLQANHEIAERLGIDLEKTNLYLQERKVLKSLQAIRVSGEHAANIVRNMHHFVRKNEASMIPTDPNQLVGDVIQSVLSDNSLKQECHPSAFSFNPILGSDLPTVHCMQEEIKQVLHNLFSNAVQSTNENRAVRQPEIIARTRIVGKKLQIEIEDNGIGINEHTKNRVFEPFYSTKSQSNVGMGLSIAYMIITYCHDGRMELESDPSWGTRFTILLPLERPIENQPDTNLVNFFGNLN